MGLEILTFHDLPKRSLAEDIENEIAVPTQRLEAWDNDEGVKVEASILVAGFLGA